MDNIEVYLNEIGRKLIPRMKAILTRERRNASYRLYNSFDWIVKGIARGKDKGFEISMGYAKHGKYVLDNKRRTGVGHPSVRGGYSAIHSLMRWIREKGISVNPKLSTNPKHKGKIRTILNKPNGTDVQGIKKEPASRARSRDRNKEVKSLAFAIWYAIKNRGSTSAPSTNFLKPYENLIQTSDFKRGLRKAAVKDGYNQIQRLWKSGNIVKIKM